MMTKKILFILLALQLTLLSAQELSTEDRRAMKFYQKAGEEIGMRNFEEGIELYKKAIERDPKFSEALYKLATVYKVYRMMDSSFHYLDRFAQVTPKEDIPANVAYLLAETYFGRGFYEKSDQFLLLVNEKKPELLNSKRGSLLRSSTTFSLNNPTNKVTYTIEKLPEEVNQYYSQYFPAITVDNRSMIFTKRDGYGPYDDEDIVISEIVDGKWTEARPLSEKITTKFNEGAATISADGRMIIFTSCEQAISLGSCDLFTASKTGDTWSEPKNLGRNVNTIHWDSQPSLSADGKSLYFSSNRPRGFGGRDIWVSYYQEDEWTIPVNLGDSINSKLDETTPYIHVNNKTLFFSSNGHPGFGGYDLFYSDYNESDSVWSYPINLGGGINDFNEQLSWTLTADGKTAYFAREADVQGKKRSLIVSINFETDSLISSKAVYITGKVRDSKTREPLEASIKMYDLQTNAAVYRTNSDPVSGKYFVTLTEGKEYGVFASAKGYLFEDFHFSPTERDGLKPDTLDILLQPIEKGVSMILENIYFEFDSYKLDPKSKSELEVMAEFFRNNNVKVQIEGHADLVGSDSYNLEISTDRARAVYNYLINLGVKPSLLSFKGFGSSRPVTKEESEQQKNRRIEFRVLDYQ